jgi:hypothetical protein
MKFKVRIITSLVFFIVFLNSEAQPPQGKAYQPVVDSDWWNIASSPDLGRYTDKHQQPVDFAVWQAADGTWQLLSCIRHTKAKGNGRIFYRWETKKITDTNWTPKGIAMEADPLLGEVEGGLQSPYVFKEKNTFYMIFGDWNRICLAESTDGKNFTRVINEQGDAALFCHSSLFNPRDPMVIRLGDLYYCYYVAHEKYDDKTDRPKGFVFCRTSADLKKWSEPILVASGGSVRKQTDCHWGEVECPFVVSIEDQYILFRSQLYGKNALNTQYSSINPFYFGIDSDDCMISQLPVAAPEIIKVKNQYYIVSLKPSLDGMMAAKLKFVKK